MTDRAKLIAALSAATEGTRELSDECLDAVGWTYDNNSHWHYPNRPDPARNLQDTVDVMVPEDHLHLIGNTGLADGYKAFRGDVWKMCTSPVSEGHTGLHDDECLALSIASLRARDA